MIVSEKMALSIRRKKAENILTISQLANLLDIHRTTLSRLLLGNCKVNKSTYEKLVNWLVEDL
ncbi:hypothetical protein EA459_05205 [Streptococcus dysgalactiae subsp. dysgalactiae]|nr:hypothetical protein [Streptococcus dysgalactiae]MSU87419.1 hypothetical protein [Streptococcus dysgalactiae subsp. dysgalactiae]QGG98038.1 hypothetical protein EA459_05205 [Streptococcus dysgalactiae subsp. dysgalactiae]